MAAVAISGVESNLFDTFIMLNGGVKLYQRPNRTGLNYGLSDVGTSESLDTIEGLPTRHNKKFYFAINRTCTDRGSDKAGHLPKFRSQVIPKVLRISL